MDLQLYAWLNGLAAQHAWLGRAAVDWTRAAPALLGLIVVLAWLAVPGDRERAFPRRTAALAIAAGLLALCLSQLIGHAWFRERPYDAHPEALVRLLIPRSPDPSFPSDHAVGAFGFATPFLVERRTRAWGLVLLAGASALAVSRVLVGTHYPTDVIGGALLGAATGVALIALARAVDRRAPALWAPLRLASTVTDGARSLLGRRATRTRR